MQKLFLLSVIVVTIAVPAIAARDPNPRRGARKALIVAGFLTILYMVALDQVFTRIFSAPQY